MILKNKKLLVITSLLTLLPIPIGLLLWNRFPETMAIHFGLTGQPDGYASIPFAVFVPPLSMLAVHWLCILATSLDKGNQHRNQKMQTIVLWITPLICNLSCCGLYALALGAEFSPVLWTLVPMGLLFVLIGNYMPKTRMNSTMGVKVPWTYSSEDNWNATHRFAGKTWVIGGILMIPCGFLPHGWAVAAMLVMIALLVIAPVVYSWLFYRKELAAGKDIKAGFSNSNKKIGKFSAISLILLAVFLCFVLFFGDIQYVFQADHLLVDTNMYTDYVLHYDDIEDIEYRQGNVPGLRVGGYGSFRLLMGFFENEEFGTYSRYTYYNPDACIVLKVQGKVVVLSAETEEETASLYKTLLDKIS